MYCIVSPPPLCTGVVVCASGDGAGKCVAGGSAALGASCALCCRLWYHAAGTARLHVLCNGDAMETAPQDL